MIGFGKGGPGMAKDQLNSDPDGSLVAQRGQRGQDSGLPGSPGQAAGAAGQGVAPKRAKVIEGRFRAGVCEINPFDIHHRVGHVQPHQRVANVVHIGVAGHVPQCRGPGPAVESCPGQE